MQYESIGAVPMLRWLPGRALIVVLLLLFSTYDIAISQDTVEYQTKRDQQHLYTDIIPANTTDSLGRIMQISLKYYEYLYDSVPGRRQLGAIGEDVRAIFPEAVEVIAQYPVQKRDGKGVASLSYLPNFPVVNKDVIFYHAIAALQELIKSYDTMVHELKAFDSSNEAFISSFARDKNDFLSKIKDFENKLTNELENEQRESLLLEAARVAIARKESELEVLQSEEERKKAEQSMQLERELLEYQEKLSLERLSHQEKLANEALEYSLSLEKEMAIKRSSVQTINENNILLKKLEYQKELESKKLELEKSKIAEELKAKKELNNINEELEINRIKLKSTLDSERMSRNIMLISSQVNAIVMTVVSEPEKLAKIAAILVFVYFVIYLVRTLISAIRHMIQSTLGKPVLVRETSYHVSFLPFFLTWNYWKGRETLSSGVTHIEKFFAKVILNSEDRALVMQLALATRNTKASGAPYRHILLHGPPGTGKTLIARKIAQSSGMDYAILSGGDVGPLGDEAVSQLHRLFHWAEGSHKGLLIFVDEAEAFLSARGSGGADDPHSRHALNALLFHTGTQSTKFALILATNRPEDLDKAILDRMDTSIKIDVPQYAERLSLSKLYMQEHVVAVAAKSKGRGLFSMFAKKQHLQDECLKEEVMANIAKRSGGFSGREISKLFIAVQYAMLLAEGQTLTKELLQATFHAKLMEHKYKQEIEKSDDR